MSNPSWSLFLGLLLITMVLVGSVLARLLLSSAMIYLAVGYALGPGGLDLINLNPVLNAAVLERIAEVAVLISLFTVGLKMGHVPLRDRRWWLPLRLAFVSMSLTVGLITLVGIWGLGLSLGAAVLLGGILAPTDPVLASGVQMADGADPDRLRFSLAGEGGLNDGTAFPFVLLGLGLLGNHDLGENSWHWWLMDLLWATSGGLLIGAAMGALIGRLVVYLRTRHHLAVGLDEFLSLGLIAVAYGAAQVCLASGFLAVFAAGLALQRGRQQAEAKPHAQDSRSHTYRKLTNHSHHASAVMTHAVQGFNEQLEKLAELVMVLLVGAMLPFAVESIDHPLALWWFIPLLFLLLRAVAVLVGTAGEPTLADQKIMLAWFGIRGIGSVFYLMYAINHGISGRLAEELVTLTLVTIAVSIVAHGVSMRPLLEWYARRKLRAA